MNLATVVLTLTVLLAAGLSLNLFMAQRRTANGLRKAAGIKGVRVPLRLRFKWYSHHVGFLRALYVAPLAGMGVPMVMGATTLTSLTKPLNDVYAGGLPREWVRCDMVVKTATNLRSGRFVKKDTTDYSIQLAVANDKNAVGVLGVRNFTNPAWDPTTAPAVDDIVEVILTVPGTLVKVRNGANLNQGDRASLGATALAAEAAAAAGDIGKVVVRVLESVDGSGAEADILAVVL